MFSQDSPEQSLGFVFWQATLLWQRQIAAKLKPLNLTHVQFVLLISIAWLSKNHVSVTQIMLAKHAKTDTMMTSKVIRTLIKKQLVERFEHPTDTRAKILRLTKLGKNLAQKALKIVENVDQEFFNQLSNRQIFHKDLVDLLYKYQEKN